MTNTNKTLPNTFTFTTIFGPCVCTATKTAGGNYKVVWNDGLEPPHVFSNEYSESYVRMSLNNREWTILKCENGGYDEGNTANIPPTAAASIYDPISFLMGAMKEQASRDAYLDVAWRIKNRQGKSMLGELLKTVSGGKRDVTEEMPLEMFFDECCECYEDVSLLEAIKSFTANTGAEVIITKGSYVVVYKEDSYNACCDEQLTEIMDAVTTLDMASF